MKIQKINNYGLKRVADIVYPMHCVLYRSYHCSATFIDLLSNLFIIPEVLNYNILFNPVATINNCMILRGLERVDPSTSNWYPPKVLALLIATASQSINR